MTNLIPENAVSSNFLVEELAEGGVDSEAINKESLYVTGHSFNYWIRVRDETGFLVFSTFTPLSVSVEAVSALRFINELNDIWSLIQFSTCEETHRLYGFYMLSFKGGLLRQQLMRTATQFPTIFADVLVEGRSRGLLAQPDQELTEVRIATE